MNIYDLFLIGPGLSVVLIGFVALVVDLLTKNKKVLVWFILALLLVPLSICVVQLQMIGGSGTLDMTLGSGTLDDVYNVDLFSIVLQMLVVFAAMITVMISSSYLPNEFSMKGEYYTLMLFSASGMMTLVSASELILLYIGLELTGLPIALLIALTLTRSAASGALKFLVISALSSAITLYGMAFLFGFTGTTIIPEMSRSIVTQGSIATLGTNTIMLVAVSLIIVGIGFKLSVVPFHMWVPDVYESGPPPIVGFLSVASKAAAFALLLRIVYQVFGDIYVNWPLIIAVIATGSMIIGNIMAMVQTNIKRMLGFSTIAHAGYLLIGVAAIATVSSGTNFTLNIDSGSAVLFYLVTYAFANLTIFAGITVGANNLQGDDISHYKSMIRKSPQLAIMMSVALIALIGIPPTGIFISKFYVFSAAVEYGLTWLVIVGVINSVISAYYYVRVIKIMFQTDLSDDESNKIETPPLTLLALYLTTAGTIWLGISPSSLIKMIEQGVALISGLN
tara:strand:+ start:10334 stop:11854 length:1521 start_codon:yes stop_codon:yes gene_type:complete